MNLNSFFVFIGHLIDSVVIKNDNKAIKTIRKYKNGFI